MCLCVGFVVSREGSPPPPPPPPPTNDGPIVEHDVQHDVEAVDGEGDEGAWEGDEGDEGDVYEGDCDESEEDVDAEAEAEEDAIAEAEDWAEAQAAEEEMIAEMLAEARLTAEARLAEARLTATEIAESNEFDMKEASVRRVVASPFLIDAAAKAVANPTAKLVSQLVTLLGFPKGTSPPTDDDEKKSLPDICRIIQGMITGQPLTARSQVVISDVINPLTGNKLEKCVPLKILRDGYKLYDGDLLKGNALHARELYLEIGMPRWACLHKDHALRKRNREALNREMDAYYKVIVDILTTYLYPTN